MGWRNYKIVSKKELGRVPILGTAIYAGGHIMVDRVDRRSQIRTLKQGINYLKDVRQLFLRFTFRIYDVTFFREPTSWSDFCNTDVGTYSMKCIIISNLCLFLTFLLIFNFYLNLLCNAMI